MCDVSVDSLCFDSTYSSHRAPHIIYLYSVYVYLTQQEGCRGGGVSSKLTLKTTEVKYKKTRSTSLDITQVKLDVDTTCII